MSSACPRRFGWYLGDGVTAFPRELLLTLRGTLEEEKRTQRLVIGIDGPGCCGKTTLCEELVEIFDGQASVLRLDDFLVPLSDQTLRFDPGEDPSGSVAHLRWSELAALVCGGLREGGPCAYRPYDWSRDVIGQAQAMPDTDVVLVEGLYALHHDLSPSYDLALWVDGRQGDRMARCEARMRVQGLTDEERSYWLRLWQDVYVPREQAYIGAQRPFERADLFVLGASLSDTRESFAFRQRR